MSRVLSETASTKGASTKGNGSDQSKAAVGATMPSSTLAWASVHRVDVDGVRVFYRSAGDPASPALLLLHGFPTSSFMFRDLIPLLANQYRVIAPDLPGFGFTEVPEERKYTYTFDALAGTIAAFTDALGLNRFAIYVFDYGAPTGFRLAMAHPERVTAIVSQNGNAYEEGLGDAWGPIKKYWSEPTAENREVLRQNILTFEGTRWQYTHGVANPDAIAPESYTLDAALLERPGNKEIQLDLFLDYATNVKLYPKFQVYFRKAQPPLLAIWGKHDPFFIAAGAEAFQKDLPRALVQFLDTGHFATETHSVEIATAIKEFFAANNIPNLREKDGVAMITPALAGSVVLVHGAWADGSSWSNVILPLRNHGLNVTAAPIPLTSLSDDSAALKRVIERTDGPLTLVAHAYGGAVIGAADHDRVRSLVYIAALAPDEAETVADVFYRAEPHPKAPQLTPDEQGLIWMPEEGFGNAVAHHATPDQIAIMAAVQRPISVKCIQEKVTAPAWKCRKSWFLIAEKDRMILPETQRFMAGRMRATNRSYPVDHTPMYTAPNLVVDVVLEAAREAVRN